MLQIRDLHTFYGESHVLQGVSMGVEKGSVTALLGRNGVGKTTLCRSLVGLTPARAGQILFDGADITRLPPHRIHALRIGLVPQGRRIFPSLTVRENLAIALRLREPLRRDRQAESTQWDLQRVLSVFPRLGERSGNRGDELSGGEQQMLAVARALVGNPVFLVLDEPTEGLAPALVAEVGQIVRRLKAEGTSVLLVEQNAAFAITLADHAHVMSKGRIVHSSDPATLWADDDVKTQLLGVPRT
ncbi:MAG: ABC transporter ATP-binding protein [Acidimicrobiia bacterium]|nr:ABC transporter ATP-binding protein [Acidimicrobiia bacterium]